MPRNLVLFDIDGTLTLSPDEIKLDEVASRQALEQTFNLPRGEADINPHGKTELQIILEILETYAPTLRNRNHHQVVEKLNELHDAWAEILRDLLVTHPLVMLPGVKDLLEALKAWSKTQPDETVLGLLTGNSAQRARVKLQSVGLHHYFWNEATQKLEGVFGNEVDTRPKLIDAAWKKYGRDARIVVVDDSMIGATMIQELQSSGPQVLGIMVATGAYSIEALQNITPHVFGDMAGENTGGITDLITKHLSGN